MLVRIFSSEGLTDEATEGQFTWASGETSSYRNWSLGQPDNAEGKEDYVAMNFGSMGKWNDYNGTTSLRGIIEIDQYTAIGNNGSQLITVAKPDKLNIDNGNITVYGGNSPDIFQLGSYDSLTTAQKVYGGAGADIFNVAIQPASGIVGIVGIDFNTAKLKDLANLLVEPDWDVREKRHNADIAAATINAAINYAAAAATMASGALPYGSNVVEGAISFAATTAHLVNDLANIEVNYNLDIEEYKNNLAGIGNFFDGQGAKDWGTVKVTQSRSIVEIMDFEPGIDTIILPKPGANGSYKFNIASNSSGTTTVEVAYNNQTNEASTFLRLGFSQDALSKINAQSIDLVQFVESLLTVNSHDAVIGTTNKNSTQVIGSTYTGTLAGDHIYVPDNNPTSGVVIIYGGDGNDLLKGRTTGANQIYGGAGDDFIVAGQVGDYINGEDGYDQVSYSLITSGVSITNASVSCNNCESVIGTPYNDVINFSSLGVSPVDGQAIALRSGKGNDTLTGSQFNDVLAGEEGNDSLVGGLGEDTANYSGATQGINVSLASGVATNDGFGNQDTLIEIEDIYGSQYDDTIVGDGENNTLNGYWGNDSLNGGENNDSLIGNAGNDILTGGSGNDVFVFQALKSEEIDHITDFALSIDKISIDKSGFGASSTSQFSFNSANGALSFGSQQFATLDNYSSLTGFNVNTDIVLM